MNHRACFPYCNRIHHYHTVRFVKKKRKKRETKHKNGPKERFKRIENKTYISFDRKFKFTVLFEFKGIFNVQFCFILLLPTINRELEAVRLCLAQFSFWFLAVRSIHVNRIKNAFKNAKHSHTCYLLLYYVRTYSCVVYACVCTLFSDVHIEWA